MSSSSEESLAQIPTRSSTRSNINMKIAMPPPLSAFAHPSSPAYTTASLPSPTQNPSNASWQPEPQHEHHGLHRVHVPTPHPVAATTSFLDKHVPMFAKHHSEYRAQHEMRAAKREARRSLVDTPIPEVDAEHHHNLPTGSIGAAIQAVSAAAAAPALADSHHALDPQVWSEIMAKREAARRRSGSTMSPTDDRAMGLLHDLSDSESKNSGSPAISP